MIKSAPFKIRVKARQNKKAVSTASTLIVTQPEKAVEEKKNKKPKKAWVIEIAKSGRSKCSKCKQNIEKGDPRMGVLTFYPFRNCKWFHFGECMHTAVLGATIDRVWGLKEFDEPFKASLSTDLSTIDATITRNPLPTITGDMDMGMFATALTSRYQRFRSFRFGLDEKQMYNKNWNWRCFLATMLVCNTHESAMLFITDKLFKVYPTPESLDAIHDDKETKKAWMEWMEKYDMRHAGRKMAWILKANRNLIENYDGDIPNDRDQLQQMTGVGRHVASITMAWVHQEPEFGIDAHVSRILKRWGYIDKKMSDVEVEQKVKSIIPPKQVGHFSRAFVDHGQQVCGFTPDCQNCYLRGSCPTAAKYADLDW